MNVEVENVQYSMLKLKGKRDVYPYYQFH